MRPRDIGVRVAQLGLAALVVWFAWRALAPRWDEVQTARAEITLRWTWILASAALVITSYAILIETWRSTLARWGHALPYPLAMRIWVISNLGKYLPGKIWQITAMGTMARDAGVPAVAAIGSSLITALINLLAGGVVVLIAAAGAGLIPPVVSAVGAAGIVGFLLLPSVLPQLATRIAHWRGRDITMPALRVSDVLRIFIGCTVAWCLYGIAFQWLAWGTLPGASGATRYYIATFTVSYLAGFLALFAPGGVGVREVGLLAMLPQFGLMSHGNAALVAVISRVWLTVLELLPGLVLLLVWPVRRTSSSDV
jgi:uncharacterized membrane protein YbhN (UPF0104 family)